MHQTILNRLEKLESSALKCADDIHVTIDGEDKYITLSEALDIVCDEEYTKAHKVKIHELQERGCGLLGALLDGLCESEG